MATEQQSFHARIQDYYSQKDASYTPIVHAFEAAQVGPDPATVALRPKEPTMPVHPSEEVAEGNITDQVAKESSESTASTHDLHKEDTGVTSGGKASAMDHKANPGPVMAENLGKPAGKEELRDRAKALNKDEE